MLVSRDMRLCGLVLRDRVSAEAVLVSRDVGLCSPVSRDRVSAEAEVLTHPRVISRCNEVLPDYVRCDIDSANRTSTAWR